MQSYNFLSKKFRSRFLHALKPLYFETLSFYGRVTGLFCRKRKQNSKKLHVGCGKNILSGFDNLDFYWWRSDRNIIQCDLRMGLPLQSNSYDYIFSEHTLEHLMPNDALQMLSECYRVLRPGGTLRLVVPDLDKYVKFATGEPSHETFNRYQNSCEAFWHLTQNNMHLSVWNFEMLNFILHKAEFSSVRSCEFNGSSAKELQVDTESRMWESLYVEASKV